MADIKLNDLLTQNNSGSDLFSDSESFLKELSDEGEQIVGGLKVDIWCALPTCRRTGGAISCLDTGAPDVIIYKAGPR
jgi:hypothetical protein